MLVRQHGAADLKLNPQIAADEFRLLQHLHRLGLATPIPYYADQSGEIFSTPYIVMEYIEGTPPYNPADLTYHLQQTAAQLARIHRVDCLELDFLPEREKRIADTLRERPAKLDDSLDEGRIRDVLDTIFPFPQVNKTGLLHGDYWNGNQIWNRGQLVGVIDWEDAALGDPLADVAIARLEILWWRGIDAMQEFTQQYQAFTSIDFTTLPHWDLAAALRPASQLDKWGLAESIEKDMREKHHWFVAQALEKLPVP